jgi:membrane-associated phospholipid phosphatase
MRRLFLVLCLLPCLISAQPKDSLRNSDAFRVADAVLHTYTAPLRWKSKNWVEFSGIVAGTAALTLADQPMRNFWQDQRSDALDGTNTIGYHYGKPYCSFIYSGAFYTAGLLFKNQWMRETGMALGTALMTAGILEMGLKPLIGRARPSTETGNYDLTFFNDKPAYHSFPSGHASMAFTVTFVMAKRTKSVPVKIFFYSLAATTAVCRLYSDMHWVSDVAFGGVLAWYCSEAALKRLLDNRVRNPHKKTIWNLSPYPGGVTLRATFK